MAKSAPRIEARAGLLYRPKGRKPPKPKVAEPVIEVVPEVVPEPVAEPISEVVQPIDTTIPLTELPPYVTTVRAGNGTIKTAAMLEVEMRLRMPIEKAIEEIKLNTWRYAKRQMTWFKRDKEIHWVDNIEEAEKLVDDFL